jgi:MGT family glycosyltransferase
MSDSIVVVCMGGTGHVQAMLPVIAGLGSRGCAVHVMTHVDFQSKVESTGARFVDLFAHRPIEAVDATSIPVPSRYVTFAAAYAESLSEQVAALAPALVVYDAFAVAGPVVARLLGLPYVSVSSAHALVPDRALAALHKDPRVAISAECRAAVERLRDVHGMSDASPFSYVNALSPYLNLYCEPAEFLAEEDRRAFAPLAFFGSITPRTPRTAREKTAGAAVFSPDRRKRIYVSFGTVVWWYFESAARAGLTAISRALADRDVDVVISLAGHDLPAAARADLLRPNVRVVDYADQWEVLEEADLFITHHGTNSTHESIFQRVPMLSYPIFSDQPALARRCQDLGLALPLTDAPQAPIEPVRLHAALARLDDERELFAARLAEARSWELRTIAERSAVLDRILLLIPI